MIFTIWQEYDHHIAYHQDMKSKTSKFCVPFLVRDVGQLEKVASLQRLITSDEIAWLRNNPADRVA